MGPGIITSLAQMLADELDVPLDTVGAHSPAEIAVSILAETVGEINA